MSLIDDVKRDREASAQGEWALETVATSCGVCHKIGSFPSNGFHKLTSVCVYEDYPPTTAPSKIQPVARRIARVPDLEAALLAADELEAALRTAMDYVSDAADGYLWHETKKDGNDALARLDKSQGLDDLGAIMAALAAYREATK